MAAPMASGERGSDAHSGAASTFFSTCGKKTWTRHTAKERVWQTAASAAKVAAAAAEIADATASGALRAPPSESPVNTGQCKDEI